MTRRKVLVGVAILAALGAGAMVGVFLGLPGLSSAQTPSPPVTRGPGARIGFGPSLQVVANDLGMSAPDVKTALAGGQSIAALAKSHNVDPQKIINDLVAEAGSRIDAAVNAGKMTSARGATIKSNLTAAVTAFVNGTRPPRLPGVTGTVVPKLGPRVGLGFGLRGGMELGIVAKDLGMSAADVKTALAGGQSIAALAKSHNVDPQKIINDVVADATSRIDAAVKAGKITSAMGDKIKAGLTQVVTAAVNGTGRMGPRMFGPFGSFGPFSFGGPGPRGHRPTSTATPASV